METSPLFARAYDLALETLKQSERMPRSRRAVLGRHMEEAALAFHGHLTAASLGTDRARSLADADVALGRYRLGLRLGHDLGLYSAGRLEELARLANECGRLLGAWRKKVAAIAQPSKG